MERDEILKDPRFLSLNFLTNTNEFYCRLKLVINYLGFYKNAKKLFLVKDSI